MKHLFVSYDIALKLKERGFDERCFGVYHANSKDFPVELEIGDNNALNSKFISGKVTRLCVAPTHQQVCDWLFGVHNISIEPYINPDLRWCITLIPNVTKTHKGSGNFSFFTGEKKITNNYEGFKTKNEALRAAIEESLKLLP